MQVRHGLAAVGLAVNHETGAFLGAALGGGQLLGLVEQAAQETAVPGFRFHDAADVLFRNHQKVQGRLGSRVVEGQELLVLVELPAGNFSRDNLTK